MSERQKSWAITREELDLRWEYANTDMSIKKFNRRFEELKKQGKIIRNGKTIK